MCVGLLIIGILPPNPFQVEKVRLKKSIRVSLGWKCGSQRAIFRVILHQFQTISRRGIKLFLNIWNLLNISCIQ